MSPRVAHIFLSAILLASGATQTRAASRTDKSANSNQQPAIIRVALLDLGRTQTAARASERLAKILSAPVTSNATRLVILDRGMSGAAARGVGYDGSLNMTLADARNLGSAIGCDFFVAGDAQTIRRSSSARPLYFESYASLLFVSARTGRLVKWDRPEAEAGEPEQAESRLLDALDARTVEGYAAAIVEASGTEEHERVERASADETDAFVDLSTDAGAAANKDLREPAPYNRLRPAYPDTASRAEAEATVDAVAEIGTDGEVARVEIVRWGGFGLDESVVSTIRRMHFHPAMRDGVPVAVRVLLRYNFRKPPRS
ncbi:MAG TPA: energy transducer TonB [Pyrinomonadaceae bacterium]|nr:energy transducer TonB [Pyrinomonadaceae bacterium]